MKYPLLSVRSGLLLLLTGILPLLAPAQGTCLLVPVPLAQRVQQAALVVEARVVSQQPEQAAGHIVTRSTLDVFKVFRGQLPAGPLSLLTVGGTLGTQREIASGTLQLQVGQQGIFMLEADPTQPGELRAYAGPQGFIRYDLASLTASEPFGRYDNIQNSLYNAVIASAGTTYQELEPNSSLSGAASQRATRRQTNALQAVPPTISGFSPASVTAGTSTSTSSSSTGVLTITGSGFGAARGTGYVQFPNADDGGTSYTQPLASDYLSWTDTQIVVRVPSESASGNTTGTGQFQVALDNTGTLVATSPSALTVTYALINVNSSGTTYRVHLIGTDGMGGYTLQYASSFPAVAKPAFEQALTSWHCQTGMNRTMSATPAPSDVAARDGVNVVRFAGSAELGTGVLGVTYSYYSSCTGSSTNFRLDETDYSYTPVPIPANPNATPPTPAYNWHYDPSTQPGFQEYDFPSVALHEQGHGEQLTHIISSTGVMNYAIANGQAKRTLDGPTDIAGGKDVIAYSTSIAPAQLCTSTAFTPSTAGCPLPVVLTAFTARYQPNQGTLVSWTTASEQQSAAFIVESQDDQPGSAWQPVVRVAAAGTTPSLHQYSARDARPLAGTRAYRLRQLDLDGHVAFSPEVMIAGVATELVAYPNPAAGTVHLSGPLATGATAQVRLLDATGRCLATRRAPAGQAAFDLPLAGVPAGLYLLEWTGGPSPCHLPLEVTE
ncbi:IPT/TIG domain-containing protein [Hymenobacter baengnokdamensis]|uniref:IPT/TIG domain-containing protein n=1 Tax=Hymenobacter baengnokdamensis TaxID=2615203 RepID=UPI0012444A0E|nr:IPT/TIG domain-containing protein [Hymenobacter baengnokdamensis]